MSINDLQHLGRQETAKGKRLVAAGNIEEAWKALDKADEFLTGAQRLRQSQTTLLPVGINTTPKPLASP
jgi:fructosamine-3-kinase